VTVAARSVNVDVKPAADRRIGSSRAGGLLVDEIADRFLELIHELEDIANSLPAQRALAEFDETTLQVFWKKWPHLSGWAGALWAMLSAELSGPSTQHDEAEHGEIGESG
jgi:hypothetical protein